MKQSVKHIVLLHGWGKSSVAMEPLGAALRVRGYMVHAFDFPGFGFAPSPTTTWGIAEYMEWTRKSIGSLNIPPPIILGHSFGARVAIKLAAAYPKEVAALVLVGAAGIPPRWTAKRVVIRLGALLGRVIPSLRRWGQGRMAHTDYTKTSGVMREVFQNVIREDARLYLNAITCPTLLVWGAEDSFTPLRDGRMMEKMIPDAELVLIKNEDHALYRKQPKIVADATTNFLTHL